MGKQFDISDLDRSVLEDLKESDARSYLISKYDIDTAKRIMKLLFPDKEETRES